MCRLERERKGGCEIYIYKLIDNRQLKAKQNTKKNTFIDSYYFINIINLHEKSSNKI